MPNYIFLAQKNSDMELLSPKFKLNVHLTKSSKRDHDIIVFIHARKT